MRRRRAEKRQTQSDLVYNSILIQKTINKIMYDGKKSLAQRIFYKSLDLVKEKTGQNPLEIFEQALNNIMPKLEVRPSWWCDIPGACRS